MRDDRLLVVKEHSVPFWKLPGGYVNPGKYFGLLYDSSSPLRLTQPTDRFGRSSLPYIRFTHLRGNPWRN